MEKIVENFSFGLFFFQTLLFVLLLAILYFIVKLYKRTMKYLDRK